jgi:hypothetical protein
MSEETEHLDELTARLRQAAVRLRDPALESEDAAALVEASAQAAADASAELDRLTRAAEAVQGRRLPPGL